MQAVRRVSSEVIVCASSAAMAMAADEAHTITSEAKQYGDLTEKEAEALLTLHEHHNDCKRFVDACPLDALFAFRLQVPCLSLSWCSGGLNALDLVEACERYAVDGQQALKAKK